MRQFLRSSRHLYAAATFIAAIFLLGTFFTLSPSRDYTSWRIPKLGKSSPVTYNNIVAQSPLPKEALSFFDQIFSQEPAKDFEYATLREVCKHTQWNEENVYLNCYGIMAGMTTIVSQVKVCLKMAIISGSGLVLPRMPVRGWNSTITDMNFDNPAAYRNYDQWFDMQHLKDNMERVCPKFKMIHPDELPSKTISNEWDVDIGAAPQFEGFRGYFWPGRPFEKFFHEQYALLKEKNAGASMEGLTIITIVSQFLAFRLTDDASGHDMRLWNDIARLVRFREEPRGIIQDVLTYMNRPFYGVHFRVELDAIGLWSLLEDQLSYDLDTLDRAWAKFGGSGEKPPVYLACGDKDQVEKFVAAGNKRGWEVTHKWKIAQSLYAEQMAMEPRGKTTLEAIDDLEFDFQGAVDMGVMLLADFFLGVTGSTFSVSTSGARDASGKYRGSTVDTIWPNELNIGDGRNHLHHDITNRYYQCCI